MIGIFGGTFDPIHNGHLRVALDVKEALGLDQIRFIPLNHPVHREPPQTPPQRRLQMLQAAIKHQPGFVADDRELRRNTPSWTLTTLHSLHHDIPRKKLALLVGSDTFAHFASWHQPDEILKLANLIVMSRPGYHLPDERAIQHLTRKHEVTERQQLLASNCGAIYFQHVTQLGISSSDIRQRLAQGRSLDYLVPTKVGTMLATA